MLDERKREVLRAVIEDYVSSGEPVGSRTVARKYGLGVSPATIRNEMADLAELGYLSQPHTSSGRIPSDKGYRYYVDCLMPHDRVYGSDVAMLRAIYDRRVRELEWLVQQVVKLLSAATGYVTVGMVPSEPTDVIQTFRVLELEGRRILLLVVSARGSVQHRVVDLPEGVRFETLEHAVALLGQRLRGMNLHRVDRGLLEDLAEGVEARRRVLEEVVSFVLATGLGEEERIARSGTLNMLNHPEFRDMERYRQILSLLEADERVVAFLLGASEGSGLSVRIGEENQVPEIQECGLVSAEVTAQGQSLGRFAVVGPKRMDYAHVVSLVERLVQVVREAWNLSQSG